MDARIQAILASYEQPEDVSEDEEKVEKGPPSPPQNLEEFIATLPQEQQEWPSNEQLHELLSLNLSVDTVGLGSLQDISEDLSTHAPFDTTLLDDAERQIQELEQHLDVYRSQVLKNEVDSTNLATPTKNLLSPTSMKALATVHPDEVINKKEKIKYRFGFTEEQSSIMKSVQYTTYPGFFPSEMTPLPGQLEAPQLLNNVIKAQSNVLPAFRTILKKLFLSEASVAILQDTFWWFFLNHFQTTNKKAQDGLFNRISDSFVALFFGVPSEYKDRFFTHYPDCLAQAVYAAYCEAFPRSYSLFDDSFKTNLLNTVSEWITGTKPPPQAWKRWNYKKLEPTNIRELQNDRTESLKANMAFDLDATLEEVQPPTSRTAKRATLVPQASGSKLLHTSKGTSDSHEMGRGPEFERVNFNIFGQSPLVSHYLKMKELIGEEGRAIAIGRTEISKPQSPAPTYKQVLDETKRTFNTRNNNYQKVLESSNQEIAKIQKQKRNALRKIDKLEKDLVLKNQDVKIISEKLLDLMSQTDYANAGYATSTQQQFDEDD